MFKLLKRAKSTANLFSDHSLGSDGVLENTKESAISENLSWFNRLKSGLQRTRQQLTGGLANLVLGKKEIDAQILDEIETHLLIADVGMEATQAIIQDLTQQVARKQLANPAALLQALKAELYRLLAPCERTMVMPDAKPLVILLTGINGAGKTTTIGKLAKRFQQEGKQVMLAAGDTFRAAAIEQLQAWGERNTIPVIAQQQGADSASVIYDAFAAAQARKIDVLLADTAGRLHTQDHLMAELQKVKRVMSKLDAHAPHEILLVLDAGIGQNTLQQAKQFHQVLGVTGLVLTKLDGTAKGGVIFALAKQLQLPIYFIGVGEGIDDLKPFKAKEFVQALFGEFGEEDVE